MELEHHTRIFESRSINRFDCQMLLGIDEASETVYVLGKEKRSQEQATSASRRSRYRGFNTSTKVGASLYVGVSD